MPWIRRLVWLVVVGCAPTERPSVDEPVPDPPPRHEDTPTPPTPRPDWVEHLGGRGMDDITAMIAEDDGSTIVFGTFDGCGTAGDRGLCTTGADPNAEPGPGETQLQFFSRFDPDGRLVQLEPIAWTDLDMHDVVLTGDGRLLVSATDVAMQPWLLWLDTRGREIVRRRFAVSSHGIGLELAPGRGGDVMVGGTFTGSLAVRGLPAVPQVAEGDSDVFVARLDGDGQAQWIRTLGGGHRKYSGHDMLVAVAATSDGGLAAMGDCRAESFAPPTGAPALRCGSLKTTDVFVAKWSADGELQWLQAITGTVGRTKFANFGAMPGTIAATADGGVAWAAMFDDTVAIGRGGVRTSSRGLFDVVIGRFAADGELRWFQQIGGPAREESMRIAVDESDATWIFLAGRDPRITRDETPRRGKVVHRGSDLRVPPQALVLSYAADGTPQHRVQMHIDPTETLPSVRPFALAVTRKGVRACATFSGTASFPEPGGTRVELRGRGDRSVPDDGFLWAFPRPRSR